MEKSSSEERLPFEEVVNCATHGVGLVLSCAGLLALVWLAYARGDAWHVSTCAVYGATLVALYASSTLYHGARSPRRKRLLRAADHCGIYLLIAGTYTPFTLVTLRGPLGWTLFGLVWGLAVAGVAARLLLGARYPVATVVSYILMGWMAVVGIKPLAEAAPLGAVLWVVAGGLAYTAGVAAFAAHKLPHNHAIWHIFVMCGSVCHFVAVALYVVP